MARKELDITSLLYILFILFILCLSLLYMLCIVFILKYSMYVCVCVWHPHAAEECGTAQHQPDLSSTKHDVLKAVDSSRGCLKNIKKTFIKTLHVCYIACYISSYLNCY